MAHAFFALWSTMFLCFTLISALDVQGKVSWNDVCPDTGSLGRARAILDDGQFTGDIARGGNFVILDVPIGTYILSIISHDFQFDQVRLDVYNLSSQPEVRPYIVGTPLNPPSTVLLPYPVALAAKEKFIYFNPPESFNLVAMMSNPMMLLMVFGGAMMLAMPYLMKNLDPETLEEFKEQHARMTEVQNAVSSGDIKSGISAIMAAAEEPSSQSKLARSAPQNPAINKASQKPRTAKKAKR